MATLKWSDKLSVGIDLIDEQHKMLIQRLNDMSTAVEFNKGPNEIGRTLSFLINRVFFLDKLAYPGLCLRGEAPVVEFLETVGDFLPEIDLII